MNVVYLDISYIVEKRQSDGIWEVIPVNGYCQNPRGKLRKSIICKAKKIRKEQMFKISDPSINLCPSNSLGYTNTYFTSIPVASTPMPCPQEAEGVKPMRTYDEYLESDIESGTDLAKTRDYLVSRLYDEKNVMYNSLREAFKMEDDTCPTSATELVDRIKSGKFIPPDPKEDGVKSKTSYYNPLRVITWRDPASPADKAGFEKAEKKMDSAFSDVKDIIMTSSEAEGLKALQMFKASIFQ